MATIDVYWSHASPYCYFALDRILEQVRCGEHEFQLRLVLPGIIRNANKFKDASDIERRYFDTDTRRTAAFLGIPYGKPDPWPVATEPDNLYRAAADQSRAMRLYCLNQAANDLGQGWQFLDHVSRLIWDGTTSDWHRDDRLERALANAGFDSQALVKTAKENVDEYNQIFAANESDLETAGHWGVPVFVLNGEPFYGQDRFDQLLWRASQI